MSRTERVLYILLIPLLEDLNLRHNEVRASGPISCSILWHSQGVSQGENIDQGQLKQAIRPPVIPSCNISSGLMISDDRRMKKLQLQVYRPTMTERERGAHVCVCVCACVVILFVFETCAVYSTPAALFFVNCVNSIVYV